MKLIRKAMLTSLMLGMLSACNNGSGKAEAEGPLGATRGPQEMTVPLFFKNTSGGALNDLNLHNITLNTWDAWYYYDNSYAFQTYVGDLSLDARKDITVYTSWTSDSSYVQNGFLFYAYVTIYFEREVLNLNGIKQTKAYATPIVFSEWYGNNGNKAFTLDYSPVGDCFKLTVTNSYSGNSTNTSQCAISRVISAPTIGY